jgi:hypothetical protein
MSEKAPVFGAYFIPFALALSVFAIFLREAFEYLAPALGVEPRWALPAAVVVAIVSMNRFPEDRRIEIAMRMKTFFGGKAN